MTTRVELITPNGCSITYARMSTIPRVGDCVSLWLEEEDEDLDDPIETVVARVEWLVTQGELAAGNDVSDSVAVYLREKYRKAVTEETEVTAQSEVERNRSKDAYNILSSANKAGLTPEKQPAVHRELNALGHSVERLHEATMELGQRMEPVLIPSEAPGAEKDIARDDIPTPPLAYSIYSLRYEIDDLTNVVRDLLKRLAV